MWKIMLFYISLNRGYSITRHNKIENSVIKQKNITTNINFIRKSEQQISPSAYKITKKELGKLCENIKFFLVLLNMAYVFYREENSRILIKLKNIANNITKKALCPHSDFSITPSITGNSYRNDIINLQCTLDINFYYYCS